MYKQKLSDCELDVMQILWDLGPEMNQPEIKEELERRKSRVYGRTTIATWMTRLKNAGFVSSVAHGKVTYFYPLVNREDYKRLELDHFSRRLFAGSYNQAILGFAQEEQLPAEELKKLEDLVASCEAAGLGK